MFTLLALSACTATDLSQLPPPPAAAVAEDSAAQDSGAPDGGAAPEDSAPGVDSEVADTADTEPGEDSAAPAASPLVFESPPRNLVVITLDTTRRDHLGRYSGDPTVTPTLDGMMREAVVLDDHRSCSNWTWASVLCTQTATWPWRLFDYVDADTGAPAGEVPASVELMSEVLAGAGFQSALVSAHPFMSALTNTDQGIEDSNFLESAAAGEIVAAGLRAAERFEAGQPWYLHLHFLDPHAPYSPPEEYLRSLDELPPLPYDVTDEGEYNRLVHEWDELPETTRGLAKEYLEIAYLGELRYFDDQLAALMEGLDKDGLLDDTLVMFWTDHGEQLFQHGTAGHGGGLYDEENRAAAFFWARGITPLAWEEPTNHTDLWPTALAALGVEREDAEGLDGRALGSRGPSAPMFSFRIQGEQSDHAVVLHDRKLHYRWDGTEQYYRLDEDPGEAEDIYTEGDPDVQALWDLLRPQVEAAHAALGGPEPVE